MLWSASTSKRSEITFFITPFVVNMSSMSCIRRQDNPRCLGLAILSMPSLQPCIRQKLQQCFREEPPGPLIPLCLPLEVQPLLTVRIRPHLIPMALRQKVQIPLLALQNELCSRCKKADREGCKKNRKGTGTRRACLLQPLQKV